jgi:hypothetical protein
VTAPHSPNRDIFHLRIAAPNHLTTKLFPAGKSADFADFLSGNYLSVNHLAAAYA